MITDFYRFLHQVFVMCKVNWEKKTIYDDYLIYRIRRMRTKEGEERKEKPFNGITFFLE